MSDTPADLRYTKEHEWVRVEGDTAVIGITAHAVDQLGDITLVTLPDPGTQVKSGEVFGDIDSVKAVSELYAPLAGEIVGRNDALEEAPELVNEEPYGKGWMIKLRATDLGEVDGLLDAKQYDEYVETLE